jgi:hypothetical protein
MEGDVLGGIRGVLVLPESTRIRVKFQIRFFREASSSNSSWPDSRYTRETAIQPYRVSSTVSHQKKTALISRPQL